MQVPIQNDISGTPELGEERSTHSSESQEKKEYHELYLQRESIELITPIQFEDGMDWTECELYYLSIFDGTQQLRSTVHLKRATQIRRPSKKQLIQRVNGQLESCLRASKYPHRSSRPPMRRSISFNTLNKCSNLYSQCLSNELKELSSGPSVNFDDYVSVFPVNSSDDYPDDVVAKLWLSKEEMDECLKGAMREQALRRSHVRRLSMELERGKVPNSSFISGFTANNALGGEVMHNPPPVATTRSGNSVGITFIQQ